MNGNVKVVGNVTMIRNVRALRRAVATGAVAGAACVLCLALTPAPADAKGATNEASKSPDEIVTDAGQAMAHLSSVRLAGSIKSGTKRISLDIVSSDGSGGGTMSSDGARFSIVVSPPDVYLRSDAASWTKLTGGNKAAGQLLAGKWLHTTTDDQDFGGFSNLFDVSTFTKSASSGPVTKGRVRSYHGEEAIPITDTTDESVAYVAATGKPYLLGIVGTGSNRGEVVFSRFGTAKVPTPPKSSIDLSQLDQSPGAATGDTGATGATSTGA